MTKHFDTTTLQSGTQVFIPLSQLKKSPKNARKMPHSASILEAYAASIAAKGILQNLVVEPETDETGAETGFYLVTIGEGRRLAQCLRVTRKEIKKTEPIPCVINVTDDPHEISLDENVTREAMHPADRFEAFRALAEERGMSVEDIAARFGISARTVKQRLRLGAVSPRLMQAYRDEALTLEQLTAFALTCDHERQEAVYDRLPTWQREASHIRRMLTETHVPATDRRALFVGGEVYTEAGGRILRDLFTDDRGGFFEDVELLDQLTVARLTAMATSIQDVEGWKWCEAYIDFPHGHGLRRAYPHLRPLSEGDHAALDAAQAEQGALSEAYDGENELPDEIDQRMGELEAEIARLDALNSGYDPDDIERGGLIVSLAYDGQARVDRGFLRSEDLVTVSAQADGDRGDAGTSAGLHADDAGDRNPQDQEPCDDENDAGKPLSDSLIRDLTTHRTLALRLTLGERPELAARTLIHTLALQTFYRGADNACLDLRAASASISGFAEGLDDTPAARALHTRHDAWAMQLPKGAADLWVYILSLEAEALGLLMAHCVAVTVNAVKQPFERKPGMHDVADRLATALTLDMTEHWRPTARSYFERVTKAHIIEAVREAVGDDAAERLTSLTKQPMAVAAEQLVVGTGWLPVILRTAVDGGPAFNDSE